MCLLHPDAVLPAESPRTCTGCDSRRSLVAVNCAHFCRRVPIVHWVHSRHAGCSWCGLENASCGKESGGVQSAQSFSFTPHYKGSMSTVLRKPTQGTIHEIPSPVGCDLVWVNLHPFLQQVFTAVATRRLPAGDPGDHGSALPSQPSRYFPLRIDRSGICSLLRTNGLV